MANIDLSQFRYFDAPLKSLNTNFLSQINQQFLNAAGNYISGLSPYLPNKITFAEYPYNNQYSAGVNRGKKCGQPFLNAKGTFTNSSMPLGLTPMNISKLGSAVPYVPKNPVFYYTWQTLSEWYGDNINQRIFMPAYPIVPIGNWHGVRAVSVQGASSIYAPKWQFNGAGTTSLKPTFPEQIDITPYKDNIVITSFQLYDAETLPRIAQPTNILPTFVLNGESSFGFQSNTSPFKKIFYSDLQAFIPFQPCQSGLSFTKQLLPRFDELTSGVANVFAMIVNPVYARAYQSARQYLIGLENPTAVKNTFNVGKLISSILPTDSSYINGISESTLNTGSYADQSGNYYPKFDTIGFSTARTAWVWNNKDEFEKFCADWGIVATDNLEDAQNTPIDFFPDTGGFVPGGGDETGFQTNPAPIIPSFPDNTSDIIPTKPPNITPLSALGLYSLTLTEAKALLSFLMTSDYTSNISELFNDKLSALGDLKMFPFDIALHDPTHAISQETLTIGNVESNISNYAITDGYNTWVDGGNISYTAYYGDVSDYTRSTYSVFIPYVGIVDIAASDIVNKTLSLKYAVDLLTGNCTAILYSDGVVTKMCGGTMGISVPITSTNANERQINSALTSLSMLNTLGNNAISSIASGSPLPLLSGITSVATQYINQQMTNPLVFSHAGAIGNSTGLAMSQIPFLIISRQQIAMPTRYDDDVGKPTTYRGKVSEFVSTGYLSLKAEKISINCTDEEQRLIKEALNNGIFV